MTEDVFYFVQTDKSNTSVFERSFVQFCYFTKQLTQQRKKKKVILNWGSDNLNLCQAAQWNANQQKQNTLI